MCLCSSSSSPCWTGTWHGQIVGSAPLIISLVRSFVRCWKQQRPLNINFQTIISGAIGCPFISFLTLLLLLHNFSVDTPPLSAFFPSRLYGYSNASDRRRSVQFIENGHPILWRHGRWQTIRSSIIVASRRQQPTEYSNLQPEIIQRPLIIDLWYWNRIVEEVTWTMGVELLLRSYNKTEIPFFLSYRFLFFFFYWKYKK